MNRPQNRSSFLSCRRMAELNRKLKVTCSSCEKTGTHDPACQSKHLIPRVSMQQGTSTITEVVTANGDVHGNESVQPSFFQNSALPAYSCGRMLFVLPGGAYQWQHFPEALETSYIEAPPIPNGSSTPNKKGNVTDRGGLGSSQSSLDGSRLESALETLATVASTLSTTAGNTAHTVTMQQLLAATPTFDGKPSNYKVWREKIDLCKPYCTSEQLLSHVRSKLGPIPSNFVASLGSRSETLTTLLDELAKKYDDYSQPLFAANQFSRLQQGNKSLSDHHAYVHELLRGNGQTVQTTNEYVKAKYCESLSNKRTLKKMMAHQMRLSTDAKAKLTLEELMNIAYEDDYCTRLAGLDISKKPTSTITAAAVQTSSVDTNGDGGTDTEPITVESSTNLAQTKTTTPQKRKKNGKGLKWCVIHQSKSHDTEECRHKDYTQCQHCKAEFDQGDYPYHLQAECQAPKCFNCGRFGHTKAQCKQPLKKRFRTTHDGPNNKNNNGQGNDNPRSESNSSNQGSGQTVTANAAQTTPVATAPAAAPQQHAASGSGGNTRQ